MRSAVLTFLMIGLLSGFSACKPVPKAEVPAEGNLPSASVAAPGRAAPFGEFNLHRKHGQGDWSGPPQSGEDGLYRAVSGEEKR